MKPSLLSLAGMAVCIFRLKRGCAYIKEGKHPAHEARCLLDWEPRTSSHLNVGLSFPRYTDEQKLGNGTFSSFPFMWGGNCLP